MIKSHVIAPGLALYIEEAAMSEMSTRSERGESRFAHGLWGAVRGDAVYLRKLGSEMRAYEERRQSEVCVLHHSAELGDAARL